MRKEKIMRFFLAAVLAISMLAMPLTTAYAESVSSSSDAAPSSAVSSSTGTESFPDASSSSGAASSPDVSSSSEAASSPDVSSSSGAASSPDVSSSSGAASSSGASSSSETVSSDVSYSSGSADTASAATAADTVNLAQGKGNDAFTLEMEGAGTDLDPATKDTTIREKEESILNRLTDGYYGSGEILDGNWNGSGMRSHYYEAYRQIDRAITLELPPDAPDRFIQRRGILEIIEQEEAFFERPGTESQVAIFERTAAASEQALEVLATYSPEKKSMLSMLEGRRQITPDQYTQMFAKRKQVFGVTFEQGRNELNIDEELLSNFVTKNKEVPEEALIDMKIALITLKYTQSNSVCYVKGGQAIGIGAGQQSRIHCTRLAGQKADNWWLRQSPQVLGLQFVDGLGRADRDNAIDVYMGDEYEDVLAEGVWQTRFKVKPAVFTREEKRAWLNQLTDVTLGSDAFFPFSDNIERAHKSGVKYIAQPGGSVRDDAVIECCDKYDMAMVFTGIRLFHH